MSYRRFSCCAIDSVDSVNVSIQSISVVCEDLKGGDNAIDVDSIDDRLLKSKDKEDDVLLQHHRIQSAWQLIQE